MSGRVKKSRGVEKKQARWGWIFCVPSLVFFSVFSFFPILSALYTSFMNRRLLSLKAPTFVGLANYLYILQSPEFWNSVRATFTFALGTFIPLAVFSLLLAVLINSRSAGKNSCSFCSTLRRFSRLWSPR